jgi:hypothetical protein
LNGYDLVVVMRAEARMETHHAAQRMATITEVAYSLNGDADSAVERSATNSPEVRSSTNP